MARSKRVGTPTLSQKALGEATAYLCKSDRRLKNLIEQVGPCRLSVAEMQSPFEALVESIVYQQLTGKAAGTIHKRLENYFQQSGITPERILLAPDDDLRALGLSRNKAKAIKDLAAKTNEGIVPPLNKLLQMEDEAIIEHISSVRGIGTWSVQMLLIFKLGRQDVLPSTDYGIRKGFHLVYSKKKGSLPSPQAIVEHGERWRPFRSVASWYLWRSLDLPK